MLVPGRTTDPRLTDVIITRVEATQDLSTAKVYYTLATELDAEAQNDAAEGLAHAEGHLRHELAGVGLRRLPHLVFTRDRGYESGQRVLDILEQLHRPPVDASDSGQPPEAKSAHDDDDVDAIEPGGN